MKKMFALFLLVIFITISLFGLTYAENTNDKTQLDKGIALFGPYGDGHHIHTFDNQVITGEIHTRGFGAIEPKEGIYDWSHIDNYLTFYEKNNKKAAIRIQSAGHSTDEMPRWIYEKYGVRQVTSQGVFFSFSKNENKQVEAIRKIANKQSEYKTTITGGSKEDDMLYLTSKDDVFLESTNHIGSYNTQIGFDYIGEGTITIIALDDGKETFSKTIIADNKDKMKSAMFLIPSSALSYETNIKFSVQTKDIKIDNLNISAEAGGVHNQDRNLTYPNFFDPMYVEKYTAFVKEFAEKYKDDPSVGAVVVGGFGRWDELSMLGDNQQENILLTKQWKAYGYDDDKFIEHVEKMCKLFKKEFGEHKEIILHIAAFSLPSTGLGKSAGDSNYVGYAVNNLAKKYGFTAKINGLTEKITEWGQAQNGFNFFAQRYKYEPNAKHIMETAAQVNNPIAYWVGHPISLFNRGLIDQIDNIWMYSVDLKLPFVQKYAHYFNQQAGRSLFSRYYNIFMQTPFKADATNWDGSSDDRILRNIWNGLYLVNQESPARESFNDEHKENYEKILDRQVIKTSKNYPQIKLSLDDRQSYNKLYGSILGIEYYDSGNDSFTVSIVSETEKITLDTIKKENTNTFKKHIFYTGDFFDTKNNGDKPDLGHQVLISSSSKNPIHISQVEINAVPSIDYAQETIQSYDKERTKMRLDANNEPITIKIPCKNPLAFIDLNIGSDSSGYVLFSAKAYEVIGKEKNLITTKEYFMPGEDDDFRIPLADASYESDELEIVLEVLEGDGYIYLYDNKDYAYNLNSYIFKEDKSFEVTDKWLTFNTLEPFLGFKAISEEEYSLTLQRKINDEWVDITKTEIESKEKVISFEPQIAGEYRIKNTKASQVLVKILNLIKRAESVAPVRYNLGSKLNDSFLELLNDEKKIWEKGAGFSNITSKDGIWYGQITNSNPYIVTSKDLEYTPSLSQIFHIIIKNETASDMIKLYWKTENDDNFSEEKTAYIPIVPNDNEFREYSYPIGKEASRYSFSSSSGIIQNNSTHTYAKENKITGLKVVPASGITIEGGSVSIASMAIREDDIVKYSFMEALDIKQVLDSELIVPINISPKDIEEVKEEIKEESPTKDDPDTSKEENSDTPIIFIIIIIFIITGGGIFIFMKYIKK